MVSDGGSFSSDDFIRTSDKGESNRKSFIQLINLSDSYRLSSSLLSHPYYYLTCKKST